MCSYETHRVRLEFVTPAFVGGADGSAELRTPPFKSLLRRWWRIAEVQGQHPNVATLREKEGRLFGHAWLRERGGRLWAGRSEVRLRLEPWDAGDMREWRFPAQPVRHPEVGKEGRDVDAHLYLGYGPLASKSERTSLKSSPALSPGKAVSLTMAWNPEVGPSLHLEDVIHLWKWFGAIGGRSRNGWGSLDVLELDERSVDPRLDRLNRFSRGLADCLQNDWPHAIGRDEKGLLLWRTHRGSRSWQEVIKELAKVKIAFRTQLPFLPNGKWGERHVLAYPVTNHKVSELERHGEDGRGGDSFRLANQIYFKVTKISTGSSIEYRGIAAHFPHRVPEAMVDKLKGSVRQEIRDNELAVWQRVHQCLDQNKEMERWS